MYFFYKYYVIFLFILDFRNFHWLKLKHFIKSHIYHILFSLFLEFYNAPISK